MFVKGMLCVFFEVGTKLLCTFILKMIKQVMTCVSPISWSHKGQPRHARQCSRNPCHLFCCVFVSRRCFCVYCNRGGGRSDLL